MVVRRKVAFIGKSPGKRKAMKGDWKQTRKGRYGEEWRKGKNAIAVFYRPDLKLATFWEGKGILFEKEVDTKPKILNVLKMWKRKY